MGYSRARIIILATVCVVQQATSRTVPDFEINLDLAPGDRFTNVVQHFNGSIHNFYHKFLNNVFVKASLFGLAEKRGAENAELQGEIEGVARLTGLPVYGVHAIQMLYELQTLMVPIENITIPWKGPGCTGILAMNKADGMVYHVRNQDFTPAKYMQNLVYTGIFTKAGKEVFRGQMIAVYSLPLTGLKKGANGFSFETNTRYLDHKGGNAEFMKNLLQEKRPFNGWTIRKIMEGADGYEAAVETASSAKLISTHYMIIGGVRKGTILARNPDNLAYQMTLGQPNYQCRDDYIIITNFDFFFHDIREWFDPTGGKGVGHPRRIAAQKILNSSAVLTPGVLISTINDVGVMAKDTIFQAVMNVETGLWNASLPVCADCGGSDFTLV
jgi:hypothetical protein